MQTYYIPFNEFNPSKLVKSEVKHESTSDEVCLYDSNYRTPSVRFQTIELKYQYETPQGLVVAPLAIEAPELYSPNGIREITHDVNYKSQVMLCIFDMLDPQCQIFCSMGLEHLGLPPGFWQLLYTWCLDCVWSHKLEIPTVARLPNKRCLESITPFPIYFKCDPDTGNPLSGINPSKYFDLITLDKIGFPNFRQTIFKAPIKSSNFGIGTVINFDRSRF